MNQLIANYYKPWLNARMNSCTVDGDFTVNGSVVHHDVVVLNDDLIVNGQTVHNGNVTVSNNHFVLANSTTENLAVNNETNLLGALNVTGLTTLNNLTVNGTVTHHGPYILNNNLLVTGTTTTENLTVNNETNLLGVLNTSGLATFETMKVNIEATIEDLIVESELIVNGITETDAIINNTSIETEDLQVNNTAQVDGAFTCLSTVTCTGLNLTAPSDTLDRYLARSYTGTVDGSILIAPDTITAYGVKMGRLFSLTVEEVILFSGDMNPGVGSFFIDFTFDNSETPLLVTYSPIIIHDRTSPNFYISKVLIEQIGVNVGRLQVFADLDSVDFASGPGDIVIQTFTMSWYTD